MPYVAMPNSGQSLGQTRDQIRNNIQSLKDSLAENHFDLDTPNEGKHKYVELVVQSPNGPPTTTDESALYTKDYTSFSVTNSNLYYRPENTLAAGNEVLLTNNFIPLAGTNGYTFLPGGLILQWGTKSFGVSSDHVTAVVLFTTDNIDFPNNCFGVSASLNVASQSETTASNTISIRSFSTTQFRYVFNSSSSSGSSLYPSFFWTAIGN